MPNVVIDGVEYAPIGKYGNIKIVVPQHGSVMVGVFSQEGSIITLHGAACIHMRDTMSGLDKIATGGPTPETMLKPCGTVTIHISTIVAIFDCDESKWVIR